MTDLTSTSGVECYITVFPALPTTCYHFETRAEVSVTGDVWILVKGSFRRGVRLRGPGEGEVAG